MHCIGGCTGVVRRSCGDSQFETCHATWDGSTLVMTNRFIERSWQWKNGQFYAKSFRDAGSGTEWLDSKPAAAATREAMKFSTRSGAMNPVQAPSLVVELTSPAAVTYHFQMFPEGRGVLMQTIVPAHTKLPSDSLESLTLKVEHVRLTQVTLDQTDAHNQLVFEKEWLPQRNEKPLQLEGNLFIAENTLHVFGPWCF